MVRHNKLAVAIAAILASATSHADTQDAQTTNGAAAPAASPAAQEPGYQAPIGEVVVTGLRSSLDKSMDIKRDAHGVVDAISAEDIGKFPDTNLAESLQRITGISIERRDGEGAQITARGFGPEFNLVTLNGRQIPGADGFGSGDLVVGGQDSGTRAFNFAQLSSDAISALTVYKTGRADVPSGGIGATLDIKTDRPFDHTGWLLNAGVKGVYDDSELFSSDITPEASAIMSYANDDKTWGVGVNASYQKRHGGAVQSTVNAWNMQSWNGTSSAMRPDGTVTNAPAIGQLYGMPNDIRYAFSDFERERINGQAVVQLAPVDSVTLTLDYTFSRNQITEERGEQTMWLQRSNSFTDLTFDTGEAVATPVFLRDIVGGKDFGFEQQHNEQEYKLDSIGFNAKWQVNDRLSFNLDAHDSKTKSDPNDPSGASQVAVSVAGTNCANGDCTGAWAQQFTFNNELPIAERVFFPTVDDAVAGTNGIVDPDFTENEVASQMLRVWSRKQETEIKEGRIDGALDFENGRFSFGVDYSKVNATRQNSNGTAVLGNWSASDAGQVPDMMALLKPFSMTGLFNDFNASGAPTGAWRGNADALAQWAMTDGMTHPETGAPYSNWNEDSMTDGVLMNNPQLANDNEIDEKTKAVYIQFQLNGELGSFPVSTVIGVRYEQTDVESTSTIAIPSALVWEANNDFSVRLSPDVQPFSEKADYDYVLPSLDFSVGLTDTLKGRVSFGQTIARAPYSNLYAGPTANRANGSVLIDPSTRATGDAQNPALKPLESDNLDVALEWYFAQSSYVSATFWNKRVTNFVGNSVVQEPLYGITDPTSGPDAQAALAFLQSGACQTQVAAAGNDVAAGCSANDTALFTAVAMLRNEAATGGLAAYNGSSAQILSMENTYDLVGEADDPLYQFNVNRPVNQHTADLNGWEFGGQYFLGDTGFGILANYTIVNGDVNFNNAGDPSVEQFALLGLSDTANAVLMYEKYGISARLAYNWRDEYLIQTNQQGTNRNPYYVEAYDQLDLSVNYRFNTGLSLGFEVINLTGEDVRWHGRSDKQLIKLIDQSPRYMIGARYNF